MFRGLLITFILLLVIGIAGFALFNSYYNSMLEPVDENAADQHKVVEIPSGASTEVIAYILESENLIQNEMVFRLHVRRHNLGQGFMAGRYSLSPSMSLEQIVQKIQAGETYTETTWFTIPEGYHVEEIAERLQSLGLADAENFLKLARQPSEELLNDFPFLQDIDNPQIEYMLEGYLFPDTYEVYSDASEEDIIRVMINRLVRIVGDPEHEQRIREMDYTLHQILALASIVEREARVDHERDRVAGVFYNRLDIGQRLESCATIQYILGETKEFLTFDDLRIPSPYNTYQNFNLPPGPIASPGEVSILAALYPEDTDYFYFNFKYDGTGEHYFSKTLDEHNQNVRRAEANIQ